MWDYIVAHWNGRLGLLRSCLLNGVAVYLLLLLVSWAIATSAAVGSSLVFAYAVAGVFLIWGIWAGVGIFRCGGRNAFTNTSSTARRGGGYSRRGAGCFLHGEGYLLSFCETAFLNVGRFAVAAPLRASRIFYLLENCR
jgi:hypothetical protein